MWGWGCGPSFAAGNHEGDSRSVVNFRGRPEDLPGGRTGRVSPSGSLTDMRPFPEKSPGAGSTVWALTESCHLAALPEPSVLWRWGVGLGLLGNWSPEGMEHGWD